MREDGAAGFILARVRARPLTVLFVVIFLAWLPGFFTIPPLDRDESRFAQASKQMLETGDFVSIRLGEQERDQKPIGIYWLQAASTAVFDVFLPEGDKGREIWTYRMVSFLGAFAALVLTFRMVRSFADVETAFFAALLLGLTGLLMSEAEIAKTDAVLLATIVGSQSVILRTYLGTRRDAAVPSPSFGKILLGWACFAIGILVKGPVIVLVCTASVAAISVWDRDWRWLKTLRPLPGILLALVLVLPWAIAIGIETHGAFYEKSLGQDFAMKLAGGQETHGAPPGYFTLLAPLTFWPASLVLLPGIVYGIRHWREPVVRYLLCWVATTWLMFELAPTKLPHYVLPAYPALGILAALWLTSARKSSEPSAERIALAVSCALFALVGLALAGLLLWAPMRFGPGPAPWLYVAAAAGVACVLGATALMLRGSRIGAAGVAALSAMILYAIAGYGTLPALDAFKLSPHLAQAVARHRLDNDPPIVLAGYSEPSAMFLLGTKTRLMNGADAGAAVANGGLAAVEQSEQESFLKVVKEKSTSATALEEIDGTNYSNGRKLRLILYRVARGH